MKINSITLQKENETTVGLEYFATVSNDVSSFSFRGTFPVTNENVDEMNNGQLNDLIISYMDSSNIEQRMLRKLSTSIDDSAVPVGIESLGDRF